MHASIRTAATAVLAAISLLAEAQLTKQERTLIEDSLFARNWRLSDLDSARRSPTDNAFAPLLAHALDSPLLVVDALLDTHERAGTGNTTELLLKAVSLAYPNQETGVASIPGRVDVSILKGQLRPTVSAVVSAMAATNEEIAAALGALTLEERTELQGLLLKRGADTDLKVRPPQVTRLKSLLAKVDLTRIRSAGIALVSAVDEAIDQLKTIRDDVAGPTMATVAGVRIMILPRKGESVDVTDADLVIALGGHNTFSGKIAAGVTRTGVLIDLGDDSSYFTRDQSMGCGLLGVGYAYLGATRTSILSGDASVGAGIAGVGVARFDGVETRVRSGSMVQGFGYQGVGLCLDARADSYWRSASWAQGAARTGGIGWLVDRGGNDFYESTGIKTTSRTSKRSSSQGYSAGYGADVTEEPGGIGLLSDLNGDDVYRAESDALGSADWRGLGSLFDRAGGDQYIASQLAVATAVHQSFGMLADAAGNDVSILGGGAGLGAAYADSVSVWLDRDGADRLVVGEVGPGYATSDSLCLRIKPAGTLSVSGAGSSVMGDVAINAFAFSEGPKTASAVNRADLDQRLFVQGPRLDLPATPLAHPGVANVDPADLDKLFDKSTEGDPVAVSSLVGAGRRALDHAVRSRLGTADGLERQLIAYLANRLGDGAAASFAPVAVSQDDAVIGSALLVGAQVKGADLSGLIPRIVREKPALIPLAVAMAGRLHSNSAVSALLPLLADSDPRVVRLTITALGQIADEASAGSAQLILNSPDPVVREEAVHLLALFPLKADVAAKALLERGDEFSGRTAIQLLGRVGTPDALTTVAGLMGDPRVGVRYSALQTLIGRMPPSAKRDLPALVNDPDPRIRALAKKAQAA